MEDETVEESFASSRFSRRSVIKAGAIVGGTVWVAPVIDSFVSRAAAVSASAGCYVCFSSGGVAFFAGQDNPNPSEAQTSCTAEGALVPTANGGPYTSGTFLLFNTTDPNGAFASFVNSGKTNAYCEYTNTSSAPAELNDSCPATFTGGGSPSSVSCVTGSW